MLPLASMHVMVMVISLFTTLASSGCAHACRPNLGLVIEGAALAVALQPQNAANLLALCQVCRAVVCCRVTPMQKAQVVQMVKRRAGGITLGMALFYLQLHEPQVRTPPHASASPMQ